MRLRNTAFLIVAGLFFLQLGVAVAASFQNQNHSDTSMKMSCHHDNSSQQFSDKPELSSQAEDHSCCKTGCQCGVGGCNSSVMVDYHSSDLGHTMHTIPESYYTLLLPQTLQNSLFRPPIFS